MTRRDTTITRCWNAAKTRRSFHWLTLLGGLLAIAIGGLSGSKAALAQANRLPEGFGLSEHYSGDRGIGSDSRVILHEDFETGGLGELGKRWDDVSNKDGKVLTLSRDVPPASRGNRSLQMTALLNENTGGHLYTRLEKPAEQVFLRFYVKFAEQAEYIHHFVHLGGYQPATAWAQGGAGSRPRGNDRFTVGIEPSGMRGQFRPPGTWGFYAYWPEMKASAGGRYWGNAMYPVQRKQIPAGQWQCVEVMLKLNAPRQRDGELALWIDGELQAHIAPGVRRGPWTGMGFELVERGGEPFEGFRWRTHDNQKINFLWLLHYVTENAARQNRSTNPGNENSVWFDDIVVATEYIGPISQ